MAQRTTGRVEPTRTTTITVTDFRTHLAKHLELAHYNGQHFLVERNHESFVVMLGVEEYRRLIAAGERRG